MADVIAYQDGNWTGSTTWKGVIAAATQLSVTNTTDTTTVYQWSPAFTIANGTVVDGVMMYVQCLVTPGYTETYVAISADDGVSAAVECVIDNTKLPVGNGGWVFFRFPSTLTGDGGADYRVGIRNNGGAAARFWRSATTNDWAKYVRTNPAVNIAATDNAIIATEIYKSGVNTLTNNFTVTMNQTSAATVFGEVRVYPNGTLNWAANASTNYNLNLGGDLSIWRAGTVNIGTNSTPIPSSSSATLQFTVSSAGQYGINVQAGGTLNMYGSPRTAGKPVTWCRLSADAAANATSVTVDADTGWLTDDQVVFAPTGTSVTQFESLNLSSNATTTGLALKNGAGTGGGLQFAHTGTNNRAGEIMNMTRNVRVRGTSASLGGYITTSSSTTCNINAQWVEFFWMGSNTTGRRGLIEMRQGAVLDLRFCSFRDPSANLAIYIDSNTKDLYLSDCVFYGFTRPINSNNSSMNNTTILNSVFIGASNSAFSIPDTAGTTTITNVVVAGCGNTTADAATASGSNATINITNFVSHSNRQFGLVILGSATTTNVTLTDCRFYHNNLINGGTLYGIQLQGRSISLHNCTFEGNRNGQILVVATSFLTMANVACRNTPSITSTAIGLRMTPSGNLLSNTLVTDCSFTNNTIADVQFAHSAGVIYENWVFLNCEFGSSTELLFTTALAPGTFIGSSRHDQTAGSHRYWRSMGTGLADSVIFKTAAPSERLTPNNASLKMFSGTKRVAIGNGTSKTINVWVRKSSVGDGTAYNGTAPRLRYRANSAAGVTSEGTLDTMTAATGTWEELSGSTPAVSDDAVLEFFVDCDGTTGWINVDDWSVS